MTYELEFDKDTSAQEHAKEKAHWLLLEKFPPVSDSTWDMPAVIARVHELPPYFGEYISPYPLTSERLDSKRWGVHGCFIVSLFSLGLISLCPIPIANWNIHVSSQAHLCSVLNSRRFPRTSSSRTLITASIAGELYTTSVMDFV